MTDNSLGHAWRKIEPSKKKNTSESWDAMCEKIRLHLIDQHGIVFGSCLSQADVYSVEGWPVRAKDSLYNDSVGNSGSERTNENLWE